MGKNKPTQKQNQMTLVKRRTEATAERIWQCTEGTTERACRLEEERKELIGESRSEETRVEDLSFWKTVKDQARIG